MIQIIVSLCGVISDESFQLSPENGPKSIPKSSPASIKRHSSHTHQRLNESWTRIKDIWDYDHQELWPASCSGHHQSPVNLINLCTQSPLVPTQTIFDPALKLKLVNYDHIITANSLRINNNGHTVQVVLRHSSKTSPWAPKVYGSACNFDTYQFRQLHFHWHQVRNVKHFRFKVNSAFNVFRTIWMDQNTQFMVNEELLKCIWSTSTRNMERLVLQPSLPMDYLYFLFYLK